MEDDGGVGEVSSGDLREASWGGASQSDQEMDAAGGRRRGRMV